MLRIYLVNTYSIIQHRMLFEDKSQQEYLTRVIWNSNIKVASEIVGGTEIIPG